MNVIIPVYCRNPLLLGNATLVFKTLRVGFPTATVTVMDCTPDEGIALVIERAAMFGRANYYRTSYQTHWEKMFDIIYSHHGEIVILDSDIILWSNCENFSWNPNALIAGRVIPAFRDEFSNALTVSRIHTSFYRIHDCESLRLAFHEVYPENGTLNPFHPLKPEVIFENGQKKFYDVGANFFHACKPEWIQKFEGDDLNRYEHLNCGSILDKVTPRLPAAEVAAFKQVHQLAQTNPRSLKGLWKEQEVYYYNRRVLS